MRGRFTLLATALLAAAQLAGQKEAVSTPGYITVDYPPNHAVFPSDFAPPTFIWRDPAADRWIITVRFATGGEALRLAVAGKPLHIGEIDSRAIGPTNKLPVLTPKQAASRTWLPEVEVWEEIKRRSMESAATLEFDGKVAAGQTASFSGGGGKLALNNPAAFAGQISGFDTAGAGSNDMIAVAGPWVFTGFTENAACTEGALGFAHGSSTLSLTLLGDYNPADFVHKSGPNGSTLITYA